MNWWPRCTCLVWSGREPFHWLVSSSTFHLSLPSRQVPEPVQGGPRALSSIVDTIDFANSAIIRFRHLHPKHIIDTRCKIKWSVSIWGRKGISPFSNDSPYQYNPLHTSWNGHQMSERKSPARGDQPQYILTMMIHSSEGNHWYTARRSFPYLRCKHVDKSRLTTKAYDCRICT